MTYIPSERMINKNQANGYAGLGADGKVPFSRLPAWAGSGTGHAAGAAPDPGYNGGITERFLFENGWKIPVGGAVNRVHLPGVNAPIDSTTLLTPATWGGSGLFRVRSIISVATAGTAGNLVVRIFWVDPSGVGQQTAIVSWPVTTTGQRADTLAVMATSGTIAYTVTFTSTYAPVVFDLDFIVEWVA